MKLSFLAAGGALWLALLVGGIAYNLHYDYTPGAAGHAPEVWPVSSALARTPGQATLVMLAHPKCPCTKASLEELAGLLAEQSGRVTAHIVFLKPENSGPDWTQTANWQVASSISGATVSADECGVEAQKFGAETSGDVRLYDSSGHLIFHGGITAARGLLGDNSGQAAVAALLAGQSSAPTQNPVFGCSLHATLCSLPPQP